MKQCYRCKIDKFETLFGKDKNKKDGLRIYCKDCLSEMYFEKAIKNKQLKKEEKEKEYKSWKDKGLQVCRKCGEEKGIEDFPLVPRNKFGVAYHCKQCCSEQARKDYEKRKEYDAQHLDEIKTCTICNVSKKTKEFILGSKVCKKCNVARCKSRHQNNLDADREYHNSYSYMRRKNDLNFRIRRNICTRLRNMLKVTGISKTGVINNDLGCSIEDLKLHLESKFQPGMTWENWGKGENCWQIDHIIPLSWFDLTDWRQRMMACHYSNTQPLWAVENNSKCNKFAG